MTIQKTIPHILQAAHERSVLKAAIAYQKLGFSVLPLSGKRPACKNWKQFQKQAATEGQIRYWHYNDILQNVGIVCGAVSNKLVVLDLDGAAGYPAFVASFPHLAETYTVATGGGVGKHIYWRVDELPEAVKAMGSPIGNLELCAEGRQIVAPPSTHPDTQKRYEVELKQDILHVENLKEIVEWIESFKTKRQAQQHAWTPPKNFDRTRGDLNPRIVEEISRHFVLSGYRQYGDWLHGTCIYPERHTNGDKNPSFGFHQESGYGHCFRCGTILAKDICERVGIRPEDYGGLMLSMPQAQTPSSSSVKLSDAPHIHIKEGTNDEEPPRDTNPPSIEDLKLPNWLQLYLDWAGSTGNQTPLSFHLSAGLWLLSVSIGRRLYGDAPWGIRLFPNLYIMLIASTTYYRKSTAYKLAEQIARAAIPHMLMPTPGSPERFQEALSGKMPSNFDDLSPGQKERLTRAQPFAAQRGLLKDEVAGLFSAMNRKDYLSGMKDLLMELYDCPDYSDKDTQTGLTIVENAALSLLGVTTPSGLSAGISHADWSNGLLIRFALITPETDYRERPAIASKGTMPAELVQGLHALHEKLPMPQNSEEGMQAPKALALNVQCWEACQAYSNELREMCNPNSDTELDERLKGVYGRMHVQAFKLASLFAALDWIDSDATAPTVTQAHWDTGKAIADLWLASAHRLLQQLDYNGMAQKEQTMQHRMLNAFRNAGQAGEKLYVIYKNLHIPAREARQTAEELVKAGMLSPIRIGRSEGYVHKDFVT